MGTAPARRVLLHQAWARRGGGRLGVAVFGASLLVVPVQALVLARLGGAPLVQVAAVLAAGAVPVAPLALLFGGLRLVREHGAAVDALEVDELTGVWSRRAFASALPDAVREARSAAVPLTLALVELAGYPEAVRELGRRPAEGRLRAAAAALAAPETVAAFRLTGELFAVVLPGVGPAAAVPAVDRLIADAAGVAQPLSASAGLCALDARCPDAELLLVGASAALHEARDLGPGRVVVSAERGSGLRWVASAGERPRI